MTDLFVGLKLECPACGCQVLVVRGRGDIDVQCGGVAMVPAQIDSAAASHPASDSHALIGKRYRAGDDLEVLCVRAGAGELTSSGLALEVQQPKLLPSSD